MKIKSLVIAFSFIIIISCSTDKKGNENNNIETQNKIYQKDSSINNLSYRILKHRLELPNPIIDTLPKTQGDDYIELTEDIIKEVNNKNIDKTFKHFVDFSSKEFKIKKIDFMNILKNCNSNEFAIIFQFDEERGVIKDSSKPQNKGKEFKKLSYTINEVNFGDKKGKLLYSIGSEKNNINAAYEKLNIEAGLSYFKYPENQGGVKFGKQKSINWINANYLKDTDLVKFELIFEPGKKSDSTLYHYTSVLFTGASSDYYGNKGGGCCPQ